MSTTNGNMKSLRVTDKEGNVYVLVPVDTEARHAIDQAKDLQFDDDFFTSEVTNTAVNIGLNGVPLGVDTDSPLKFVQDTQQGIVFGSNAPFSTAIAPEYNPTATYAAGDHCMHLGKYFRCNTAIPTAEAWNPAHWAETDIIGDLATVATTGSYTDLSNTPASTLDQGYLRTYDGHSVYAARTDCDKDGNDLTLGIDGTTNTVTDNSGEPVQDSSGNPLADAESDARVVSIGELPIWADRAEKDTSGNDIETTYATKQEMQDALGDLETILASI